MTRWTKEDLAQMAELAAELQNVGWEPIYYCDCCNIVEVEVPWAYCNGCITAITEYMEKDEIVHKAYLERLENKLEDYHYSDGAN